MIDQQTVIVTTTKTGTKHTVVIGGHTVTVRPHLTRGDSDHMYRRVRAQTERDGRALR